jgi:hypothetical protein
MIWLDVKIESITGLLIGTVGWLIFMCISYPVGVFISGIGVRLLSHTEKYKKSYGAEYGKAVAKPSFMEYNLSPEDYYAYNRRWRFSDVSPVIIAFFALGAAYLFKQFFGVETTTNKAIMFGVALFVAILVGKLVSIVDQIRDSNMPQYEAAQRYSKAMKIYKAVEEELRQEMIKSRF